jgi:hypothetical protein
MLPKRQAPRLPAGELRRVRQQYYRAADVNDIADGRSTKLVVRRDSSGGLRGVAANNEAILDAIEAGRHSCQRNQERQTGGSCGSALRVLDDIGHVVLSYLRKDPAHDLICLVAGDASNIYNNA